VTFRRTPGRRQAVLSARPTRSCCRRALRPAAERRARRRWPAALPVVHQYQIGRRRDRARATTQDSFAIRATPPRSSAAHLASLQDPSVARAPGDNARRAVLPLTPESMTLALVPACTSRCSKPVSARRLAARAARAASGPSRNSRRRRPSRPRRPARTPRPAAPGRFDAALYLAAFVPCVPRENRRAAAPPDAA
jgi:hypothetical protein